MSRNPAPVLHATDLVYTPEDRQRVVEELSALGVQRAVRLAAQAGRLAEGDSGVAASAPDVVLMARRIGVLEQTLAWPFVGAEAARDADTLPGSGVAHGPGCPG